jgi:chromosome segregation ATPase
MTALTAEQVPAAAANAVAERDAIQANLLELDSSFVKQVLEGATLAGQTRQRWGAASATLAELWQIYLAYSAVVDRAAELAQGRPARKDLPELISLLTGSSVRLARAPTPLASRDLADTGRENLTLAAAVARMRRMFTEVAEVTAAVEAVWSEVGSRLDAAAEELARARRLLPGLGDEDLAARLDATTSSLASLRAGLEADPLALWRGGRADTSAADLLREQVADVAAKVAELERVRQDARRRIERLRAPAAAARAARQDALAAWQRTAERIAAMPPPPPEPAEPPYAALTALADTGRWRRLETELSRAEGELAAATSRARDAERTVASALDRRDELRGLLGAYKVKAARLGAAEEENLTARYDRARDLLWTAPCDLTAAEDAVTGYQRAIREIEGRRR